MATVLERPRYDRSIVEGPLQPAVWKIAWPTMLTNVVGGLQGIIDHVLVGHLVGFTGNAAIGVSWQIILVVIVFISSLFSGMSVLVSRFAGAGRSRQGRSHGVPGVSHRDVPVVRRDGPARLPCRRRGCSTS